VSIINLCKNNYLYSVCIGKLLRERKGCCWYKKRSGNSDDCMHYNEQIKRCDNLNAIKNQDMDPEENIFN
jgi:hypothetical protein